MGDSYFGIALIVAGAFLLFTVSVVFIHAVVYPLQRRLALLWVGGRQREALVLLRDDTLSRARRPDNALWVDELADDINRQGKIDDCRKAGAAEWRIKFLL